MVTLGQARCACRAIIDKMPQRLGLRLRPAGAGQRSRARRDRLIQPGSISSTAYRLVLPRRRRSRGGRQGLPARFPDGGWRATDRNEAGSGTRRFIDRLGQLLLMVALSALAIGGLGMSSAAAAFAASRRQSIAILKLVGAPRRTIHAMLLIELGLIAGLAIARRAAVGAAAPVLVAKLAGPLLPVAPDPSPQWLALGQAALFGVLISFAASWRAIVGASDTRPAQLLRGAVDGARPSARHLIAPTFALAARRRARHLRRQRPAASRRSGSRPSPGCARCSPGSGCSSAGLRARRGIAAGRSPGSALPRSTAPARRPCGWRCRSGLA